MTPAAYARSLGILIPDRATCLRTALQTALTWEARKQVKLSRGPAPTLASLARRRGLMVPDSVKDLGGALETALRVRMSATLFKEEAHPRDTAGKFTAAHVAKAKADLGAGCIGVKTSGQPIRSDASGLYIRRFVELGSGHRLHPDELQRMHGTQLDSHERLSVRDPALRGANAAGSFNRALSTIASFAKRPEDLVAITSPYGHTVNLRRHQWADLHSKSMAKQFHEWFDAEGHAAKAAAGPDIASAEKMGKKETADFFTPESAKSQGRLFMSLTATEDESQALAEHYADLFNLFEQAHLTVPDNLLADAHEDANAKTRS